MMQYRYYLTQRPRDIGTCPSGYKDRDDYDNKKDVSEVGHPAYG